MERVKVKKTMISMVKSQKSKVNGHFFTRFTQWEYHPWWLANIPVYGFWLWFAARSRHLIFFSNVNPAIPLGGAMGESKWDILKLLPPEILPKTIPVEAGENFEKVTVDL